MNKTGLAEHLLRSPLESSAPKLCHFWVQAVGAEVSNHEGGVGSTSVMTSVLPTSPPAAHLRVPDSGSWLAGGPPPGQRCAPGQVAFQVGV